MDFHPGAECCVLFSPLRDKPSGSDPLGQREECRAWAGEGSGGCLQRKELKAVQRRGWVCQQLCCLPQIPPRLRPRARPPGTHSPPYPAQGPHLPDFPDSFVGIVKP